MMVRISMPLAVLRSKLIERLQKVPGSHEPSQRTGTP
jgi:hypothetical protein